MPDDSWQNLFWPLLRLLCGLSLGLFVASLLETLRLTDRLAAFAHPLARLAHFQPVSGAAFSLAFISPASANALLSGAKERGAINLPELVLVNIFNSFPTSLLHVPALLFLLWPALGAPALAYIGISLLASLGRTALVMAIGHFFLPAPDKNETRKDARIPHEAGGWQKAYLKAKKRFLKRLPKLLLFTIPVYLLMHLLQSRGIFALAEAWLSGWPILGAYLKPGMMGMIAFSLAAELGAAIGAGASLLRMGVLTGSEVVVALLVGNILATPMRAIRHQLPAYAGFYRPGTALCLVVANQLARASSMIAATALYALWSWPFFL